MARAKHLVQEWGKLMLYSVDVVVERRGEHEEQTADIYAYSELEAQVLLKTCVKKLISHEEISQGVLDRSYLTLGRNYNPKPRVKLY